MYIHTQAQKIDTLLPGAMGEEGGSRCCWSPPHCASSLCLSESVSAYTSRTLSMSALLHVPLLLPQRLLPRLVLVRLYQKLAVNLDPQI